MGNELGNGGLLACAATDFAQTAHMSVAVPEDWVESVANLRFPAKADHRLQELMDRNNEGLLNDDERKALEALVELNEEISLVRSAALGLLRLPN